jgi:membrane protein DedA with SNARE-associated domain
VVFSKDVPVTNFIVHYGLYALFILAFVESTCAPIPSEGTFGFAGAMTAASFSLNHGHPWNVVSVIVVGVVGSLAGSIFAYEVLGLRFGRTIVDRWGKWLLLTHADLDTAERWFEKYGSVSVLVGRVIPVVRTVISVPAGVARMNRAHFAVLTTVGCAVWVTVLTLLGRAAGQNWEHVSNVFHKFQLPVIAILVILLAVGLRHRIQKVRQHHQG